MNWLYVLILAVIQGMAELLPVSSSAHVIVAAKLLHEDMTAPANTLLLVMLHTGTMFAVLVYFWRQWRDSFFSSKAEFGQVVKQLIFATVLTAVVGYPLIKTIEHAMAKGGSKAEIELLFNRLHLIAPALAAAGILILIAGLLERRKSAGTQPVSTPQVAVMGVLQGLVLPFRGFSRSGSTISGAMFLGNNRKAIESFSFAMAIVITPPAIARELLRVAKLHASTHATISWSSLLAPSLLGMVAAFFAGLLALKWLSSWLENGRWYLFGIYCLAAAAVVETLALRGW